MECDLCYFDQMHQISDRHDARFFHYATAVGLDGLFRSAWLASNLSLTYL